MKNLLLAVGLTSILFVISCGDGNVVIQADPAVQAAEDSALIVNYLADLGYDGDEVGITSSGVRYVVLDSGNTAGLRIDESDILSLHYTGKLLNDTIFDTSIVGVADSIRLTVEANITEGDTTDVEFALLNSFRESRDYEAFKITYSTSGWPFPSGLIQGYKDGIAASLNELGNDAMVLIIIPSAQAYGPRGSGFFIAPNEVIAFELYPFDIKKQ